MVAFIAAVGDIRDKLPQVTEYTRFTDVGDPRGLSRTSGKFWQTAWCVICCDHKTQYILIHAAYTRIVVFHHISDMPPQIS